MKKSITGMLIFLIALTTSFFAADSPDTQEDIMRQVVSLYREGNFTNALELTDKAIKDGGENLSLLQARFAILMKLNRLDEALTVALRREELDSRKRPWVCMDIAGLYIRKGQSDKALNWLEKAVQRGFTSISMLQDDVYNPIRDQSRFQALVKRIKERIGIGSPAKDFSIALLNGEKLNLADHKGKVVLIDFWATWCAPCREEIPHLKEIYAAFNAKGLEIIGISLDRDRKALTDYISEKQLKWPIAFSGQVWSDETAALYGVQSIPSMWLVDRDGILRHFDLRGDELRQAIARLITAE